MHGVTAARSYCKGKVLLSDLEMPTADLHVNMFAALQHPFLNELLYGENQKAEN